MRFCRSEQVGSSHPLSKPLYGVTKTRPPTSWRTPRATWCWALARHRTSFSQPGHSRQRAVGPRCGRRCRSRSYRLGIFTTAPPVRSPMHLRPGMWSPVSLRGDSRPSRGSAALTFPTSGFSTERVGGPHASQMHGGDSAPAPGGAVLNLKKIAARFSFCGLRARKDTIAHATESRCTRSARAANTLAWCTLSGLPVLTR